MAVSVKQLNGDASFLLAFQPIAGDDHAKPTTPGPFHILLDPWLSDSCYDYHPSLSKTSHRRTDMMTPLEELPEPDIVIISQDKSDHCNEATLRRLPGSGTRTIILAEPSAAKKIQSWGHFDHGKVHSLPRWEDPRKTGREAVVRMAIPALASTGDAGEVTVALIHQRGGLRGHQPAIGITYRPPTLRPPRFNRLGATPPSSSMSNTPPALFPLPLSIADLGPRGTPPPQSPSLRSQRSAVSLTPALRNRVLSVLFAPHGAEYACLEPYVTSHLVSEAALPLTVLLHCFDDVEGPWWDRRRSWGMMAGLQTAVTLGAKAWVRTHDGEKDVRGLIGRRWRRRPHRIEDVRWNVERAAGPVPGVARKASSSSKATEVLVLDPQQEVAMTCEGVWQADPVEPPEPAEPAEATDSSTDSRSDTLSSLRLPTLSKYGMDDLLASITSDPILQHVRP